MGSERVIVLSGPLRGEHFEIDGALSIGRSPENHLHLNDIQVSRKHALIVQTPAGTVVRDLGSGNGTYIGEGRIQEHRLSDGDVIRVGPFELRFEQGMETLPEPGEPQQSIVLFETGGDDNVEASAAANVYQTFFSAPKDAVNVEHLREVQARLAAIYEANQIISSEHDLGKLFERVMEQIFSLVPAHNGVILLRDTKTGELLTEYTRSGAGQSEVKISRTIVRRAFENEEAILTYDAAEDVRFDAGASIIAQNISSAMCAPLTHQNETLGVVYVDTRGTTNAFTQRDVELLVALSGPAAIAIKNAQYLAKLEQAYRDTLIALANAIEARDHYTVGHTWRVTNFAMEIARVLGWSEEKLKECEMGGVLHDVGKIAVDDAILLKKSGLTPEEYTKMKAHPERGSRMMQDIESLVPLIPYALYHHERYDGKGYPFGLKGEEIPIEGRVLAVADTFDAMTSNRPYRKGLDPEYAIKEIEKGKGAQFDPACTDALVKCYREGRIARVLQDYYKGMQSLSCPFCSTHMQIPQNAVAGDNLECGVCHRRMRLEKQGEAYFGVLLAETDSDSAVTPVPDPASPNPSSQNNVPT